MLGKSALPALCDKLAMMGPESEGPAESGTQIPVYVLGVHDVVSRQQSQTCTTCNPIGL